jgi:hypothetical protein
MPNVNQPLPLNLQLWDRAANKYVTATVRLPSGTPLSGSPVELAHVSSGYYASNDLRMPQADYVTVFYEVFDDAAHTVRSADHAEAFETLSASSSGGGGGSSGGDEIFAEISDADISLVAVVEDAKTLRGVI